MLTVPFMSAQRSRRLFTVGDCLRMEEAGILSPNDHVELIHGEILLMSPIGPRHGTAVDRTTRAMVLLAGNTFERRGVWCWTRLPHLCPTSHCSGRRPMTM